MFDFQFGTDKLCFTFRDAQGGSTAIGILHHADRNQSAAYGDAFGESLLNFVMVGLHLVYIEHRGQRDFCPLLDRNIGDIVRHASGDGGFGIGRLGVLDVPQTASHSGHVYRGVATTHHYHTLANMLQTPVVKGAQKGGRGDHIGRFAVRSRQCTPCLCSHAEKHGVVIFANLFQRDILADVAVELGLDTKIEDALNFGVKHFARGTKTGNAVAHHAAEVFVFVKNGDGMPFQGQLIGTRQAGRSAADQGNFLAGRSDRWFVELEIVGNGIFAEKVFNRIDADMIFHFVAIAARFARSRANAPHY